MVRKSSKHSNRIDRLFFFMFWHFKLIVLFCSVFPCLPLCLSFFLSISVSFFVCFFHFFLLFFFLHTRCDFQFPLFVVIGYDQPCDLRLLTPATCLKELSEPVLATKSPPNLLLLKTDLETHTGERTSPRKSTIAASASSASSAAAAATTATTTGTGAASTNASNNNIFMCKQCGNSYARPHSLNRHIRFECGVEPKFECPICRKKSKHKHNLVLHMRTHQHRWFKFDANRPTKKTEPKNQTKIHMQIEFHTQIKRNRNAQTI